MLNMIVVHEIITTIFLINGFQNTIVIDSAAVRHRPSNCILVIGGYGRYTAEYYHPYDECNNTDIPILNLSKKQSPVDSSGCYLEETQQIVVRENKGGPSIIYWLRNGTMKQITRSNYTNTGNHGTTSASLGDSRCLSCGDAKRSECYEFNKSTNRWTPIQPLPKSLHGSASVSLGLFYYVIGGGTSVAPETKKLFCYHSKNNSWVTMEPMAIPRSKHSAAALSADEFIVCGRSELQYQYGSTCEVYNVTSGKWANASSMTTDRKKFALVNFNGQVFAIGGYSYSRGAVQRTVEVYNQKNNSWSTVNKQLKATRYGFVAFAVSLPPPKSTTTATTSQTRTMPTTTDTENAPPQQIAKDESKKQSVADTTTSDDPNLIYIILLCVLLTLGIIFLIIATVVLCIFWRMCYFRKDAAASDLDILKFHKCSSKDDDESVKSTSESEKSFISDKGVTIKRTDKDGVIINDAEPIRSAIPTVK